MTIIFSIVSPNGSPGPADDHFWNIRRPRITAPVKKTILYLEMLTFFLFFEYQKSSVYNNNIGYSSIQMTFDFLMCRPYCRGQMSSLSFKFIPKLSFSIFF